MKRSLRGKPTAREIAHIFEEESAWEEENFVSNESEENDEDFAIEENVVSDDSDDSAIYDQPSHTEAVYVSKMESNGFQNVLQAPAGLKQLTYFEATAGRHDTQ